MGSLTQILHYFNSKHELSETWIEQHYSHFRPTFEDKKIRAEIQLNKRKVNSISRPKKRIVELDLDYK